MATTHIIVTERPDGGLTVRQYESLAEAETAAVQLDHETGRHVGADDHGLYRQIGVSPTQGHSLLAVDKLSTEEREMAGL